MTQHTEPTCQHSWTLIYKNSIFFQVGLVECCVTHCCVIHLSYTACNHLFKVIYMDHLLLWFSQQNMCHSVFTSVA